jgi:hypothetical protein
VVATADVLRLQKNPVAKTSMCVIATLSHVIAKQVKVTLQKTLHAAEKKKVHKNIVEFQFTNSNKKRFQFTNSNKKRM